MASAEVETPDLSLVTALVNELENVTAEENHSDPVEQREVVEADPPLPESQFQSGLKHLGFMKLSVIYTLALISTLYWKARESTELSKSVAADLEYNLSPLFLPLAKRLWTFTERTFIFADDFVDFTVKQIPDLTPEFVKDNFVFKSLLEIQEAYDTKGFSDAKALFHDKAVGASIYSLITAWRLFLSLPLVPQLVKLALPLVVLVAGFYNSVVTLSSNSSLPVVSWIGPVLPIVPVESLQSYVKKSVSEALKVD